MKPFFDTNVLIYAVSSDPRRDIADRILHEDGVISMQVLNEFTNVSRNKLKLDWARVEEALARFCEIFEDIVPLNLATHSAAVALARDHGVAFYDALIVAAALEAECQKLYSEDLQHGRRFGDLTIINPFL